jgi:DNA invertase Pin-like site-specific DNA recombinase
VVAPSWVTSIDKLLKNIKIKSMKKVIKIGDSTEKLMMGIKLLFAEYEHQTMSERIKRGLENKKAKK